jgi:hypothetical protein
MTTTHDNATTWRDLVGDLTADEVTGIEGIEREFGADTRGPAILLKVARDYVLRRTVDAAYADIPLPVGATDLSGWEKNLQRDGWSRTLVWRTWDSGEMAVDIAGRQECDGTYTRQISLEDGADFTSTGARQLARALIEAADEFERLTD